MYKPLQICFALLVVIPTSRFLSLVFIKLFVRSEKKVVRLSQLFGLSRFGGLVGVIALVRSISKATKKYNNRAERRKLT